MSNLTEHVKRLKGTPQADRLQLIYLHLINCVAKFDELTDGNNKHFEHLRTVDLPFLLDQGILCNVITEVQYKTLSSQIESPDRENWYIAFLSIKRLFNLFIHKL